MPNEPLSRSAIQLAGLISVLAATLASFGDILLLYNGMLRAQGSAAMDAQTLVAGHYLGVLCIPLYAVGYWLVSRGLRPSEGAARLVFLGGCYLGAVGAAIHGVTAVIIETGPVGVEASPVTVPHAVYLLPLWLVLFAVSILASAAYALAVAGGRTAFPRWAAAFNPVFIVLAMIVASLPFPALAAYTVPASANLAHILFFGVAIVLLSRKGPRAMAV
jgi:uncharacterized membrane protein YtjA (UPF0391 family)